MNKTENKTIITLYKSYCALQGRIDASHCENLQSTNIALLFSLWYVQYRHKHGSL